MGSSSVRRLIESAIRRKQDVADVAVVAKRAARTEACLYLSGMN